MAVHLLDEMTWEDVRDLPRDRSIFFLPVSPIEEHGPHLPLGTDFYAARDATRAAAEVVVHQAPEVECVVIPGLPVGCAEATMDFPGTISLRGETLVNLIYDVGRSLARHGFLHLLIANHHLDLIHVKAIQTAIERLASDYPVRAYEPASAIVYSDAYQGTRECALRREMGFPGMNTEMHADVSETSFVKACYPGLLREVYDELPPCCLDLSDFARKGITRFREMGAERGYVGTPSAATEELGRLHIEEAAWLLADAALSLYRGEALPQIGDTIRRVLAEQVRLD